MRDDPQIRTIRKRAGTGEKEPYIEKAAKRKSR
jgi:hypothetical protein